MNKVSSAWQFLHFAPEINLFFTKDLKSTKKY
jgi:hypothetical protein